MFEPDFTTTHSTETIIDNWLKRSNLVPASLHEGQGSRSIETCTKVEEILLEGDAVIEPFLQDAGSNFAKQLEEYYERRINEPTETLYGNELASLFVEERSIWKLANALYTDRYQRYTNMDDNQLPPSSATDFQLVQHLLTTSESMADAAIVRNWLEKTAPSFQPVSPRKGGWYLTQAEIKNKTRPLQQKPNNIITELDPDAVYRQEKRLVPEDEMFENRLLRTIYFLIRRGKIEEAITLVSSSDQSWRAASIRGGLYFRDPKLENNDFEGLSYDLDCEDDANTVMGDEFSDVPAGNLNRFLWKSTCYAISKESKNPKYERALYAILCGDLDTLLQACETWEDYLWAYYNCLMESRIETYFRQCGRTNEPTGLPTPPLLELTEKEIFENLEQSPEQAIYQLAWKDYSQIKKHMILGSLDELIEDIHVKLTSPPGQEKSHVDFRVIRTVSLLILFLRTFGLLQEPSSGDLIIQVYIYRLSQLNQFRFAILYCSKLSNNMQVDVYANLLSSINDSLEVRLECLRYGSMYGLNFDQVLLVTAEKSLESAASKDLPTEGLDPERFSFTTWCEEIPLSVVLQVRAFEWINHESSFFAESISLCNSACRRFLKSGRVWAANVLLTAMPKNFVLPEWRVELEDGASIPDDLAMSAQEYLNYDLLLDGFRRLDKWKSLLHIRPSSNSNEYRDWEAKIKESTVNTEEGLREILSCDWMNNCFPPIRPGSTESDMRKVLKNEVILLRRLYIPEIVFSLYDVLMQTIDLFPNNVFKALELSEMVAYEKLGIYKVLMNRPKKHGSYNSIPLFLDKMQQAGKLVLEKSVKSKDSCFFPDELTSENRQANNILC